MPFVTILGLRGNPDNIRKFRTFLSLIIASVEELELTPEEVTVYILNEFAPPDPGSIVVKIEGLHARPGHVFEQNVLARIVWSAVATFLKLEGRFIKKEGRLMAPLIEVFVYTFDPVCQGFVNNHSWLRSLH